MTWPYETLALGLDDGALLAKLGTGAIPPPSSYLGPPSLEVGHSPALWPMWSDGGSGHVGIWHHVLLDRRPTVVRYDAETATVDAIATTAAQLVDWLLVQALTGCDDDDDEVEDVRRWADTWGFGGVDQLDLILQTATAEVSEAELLRTRVPSFAADPPGRPVALADGSTFEAPADLPPDAPAWLTTRDQRPVFEARLAAGDLRGAWLSLASSGWRFADALDAIGRLAATADDMTLHEVASVWSEGHGGRDDGY